MVSIIIPTQDQVNVLDRCLESIARSTYTNYEVLLIENQSRQAETFDYYRTLEGRRDVRLVPWNQRFNYSKLNNFAASQARGEVLLLLNNDTEARDRDWLERMLEHALRPEVGAVGAKLFYPGGEVQHGGIILGIKGVAGHAQQVFSRVVPRILPPPDGDSRHVGGHGRCVMLRKEVFEEIEGFDERLAIAFNERRTCACAFAARGIGSCGPLSPR